MRKFNFTKHAKIKLCITTTQPAFTCSKLAIETVGQGVEYVQS